MSLLVLVIPRMSPSYVCSRLHNVGFIAGAVVLVLLLPLGVSLVLVASLGVRYEISL